MSLISIYLLSLLLCVLFTTLVFSLAIKKKNNSIMDIAYGQTFIFAGIVLAYISISQNTFSHFSFIILFFILIWGVRLSYRIYKRNKGKEEDFRYATWRELWSKKGKVYFFLRSYLQIFVLHAFIVSLVLLPLTLSLSYQGTLLSISLLTVLGIMLWMIGFFFEAVGDAELDSFIAQRNKHGKKFLTTGLFSLTRHPNYFGEATMWLGLATIALSGGAPLLVLISPVLITFLLLYVSGIPMVEKRWKGDAEWEEYAKSTRTFFPFPKKP